MYSCWLQPSLNNHTLGKNGGGEGEEKGKKEGNKSIKLWYLSLRWKFSGQP